MVRAEYGSISEIVWSNKLMINIRFDSLEQRTNYLYKIKNIPKKIMDLNVNDIMLFTLKIVPHLPTVSDG